MLELKAPPIAEFRSKIEIKLKKIRFRSQGRCRCGQLDYWNNFLDSRSGNGWKCAFSFPVAVP
jgi:hypothetical protein